MLADDHAKIQSPSYLKSVQCPVGAVFDRSARCVLIRRSKTQGTKQGRGTSNCVNVSNTSQIDHFDSPATRYDRLCALSRAARC